MPSYHVVVNRTLYRIIGTLIGCIIILLVHMTFTGEWVYLIDALTILLVGHLSIKYYRYHYAFAVCIITIGALGWGYYDSIDLEKLQLNLYERSFQIILGSLFATLPIVFIYFLRGRNKQKHHARTSEIPVVLHRDFFLRTGIGIVLFLMVYKFAQIPHLKGAAVILAIFIGIGSLHANPIPLYLKGMKAMIVSVILVTLVKILNPPLLLLLIITVLFYGSFMYLAFKIGPPKSMFYRLILVMSSVVYVSTPKSFVGLKPFVLFLVVALSGLVLAWISCLLSSFFLKLDHGREY